MNRRWAHILLLTLLIGSFIFQGCKKEESVYGNWITFSAEETGIEEFREYTICADVSGNIYAVQESDVSGIFNLFYHPKESDDWLHTEFPFIVQDPIHLTDENHMKNHHRWICLASWTRRNDSFQGR